MKMFAGFQLLVVVEIRLFPTMLKRAIHVRRLKVLLFVILYECSLMNVKVHTLFMRGYRTPALRNEEIIKRTLV